MNKTLETLERNGYKVNMLIYCSPREIQKNADDIRKELRKKGIALDVRDKNWFIMVANSNSTRSAAAEELVRRKVSPLLATLNLIESSRASLSDDQERIAAAYLQTALANENPEANLASMTYGSLVEYAVRETTLEKRASRQMIHDAVRHLIRSEKPDVFADRVNGALARLVAADHLKHHTKDDTFTLSVSRRNEMAERLASALANSNRANAELMDRVEKVAKAIEVDFSYPIAALTDDTLLAADRFLFEQGRATATSFESGDFGTSECSIIPEFVQKMVDERPQLFKSLKTLTKDQAVDLISALLEDTLRRPTDFLRKRLRCTGDAYCLLFVVRETDDVKRAIDQLIADISLIVDASIIVPCLAEIDLPHSERSMLNLIAVAKSIGIKLFVTDDVINELVGHLRKIRAQHYAENGGGGGVRRNRRADPILLDAFTRQRAAGKISTMQEFIDQFIGDSQSEIDMIEFLETQVGIRYSPLDEAYSLIDPVELEEVIAHWKLTRKSYPGEEEAIDRLIRHDARALLVVEALRKKEEKERASPYGHRWWWLTLDSAAYQMDRTRRHPKSPSNCMSPDYFTRYVSIRTRSRSEGNEIPLSVEVAALGFIPPEIVQEVKKAFETMTAAPIYLRQRKIRDLMNKARATKGDYSRGK